MELYRRQTSKGTGGKQRTTTNQSSVCVCMCSGIVNSQTNFCPWENLTFCTAVWCYERSRSREKLSVSKLFLLCARLSAKNALFFIPLVGSFGYPLMSDFDITKQKMPRDTCPMLSTDSRENFQFLSVSRPKWSVVDRHQKWVHDIGRAEEYETTRLHFDIHQIMSRTEEFFSSLNELEDLVGRLQVVIQLWSANHKRQYGSIIDIILLVKYCHH